MENQKRPFGMPACLCSSLGLFSLIKNGVRELTTFPRSWSEFSTGYPETIPAGTVASPELVPRDQDPGRPVPVHHDREDDRAEKSAPSENDLKVSELKYRRLFETAQDAILILDGDNGKIIDANTFILDLLGYPLDYFMGKHLWTRIFQR